VNWTALFDRFSRRRISVFADFIDPFCYIGFHNLRAASQRNGIVIRWHGFELNPDTPLEGFAAQPASNSDLHAGMWASVCGSARKSGLELVEPPRIPNTEAAHSLVYAARKLDVKNPLIERIYRAYFSEQRDIGNRDVLTSLAQECGMPAPAWEEILITGRRAVARARAEAQQRALPGMPAFRHAGQTFFGALPLRFWNERLAGKATSEDQSQGVEETSCLTK